MSPPAPSEYETMMIEKYLKETIIEHAKVFYSNRWPIESNWAVVTERDEDGLYQAFLYAQPGTTGTIRYQIVDGCGSYGSKKDALQELLEELEGQLARG